MISVTKSFLPEKKLYEYYLDKVWENQWLTNQGNLSVELKNNLGNYLDINDLALTSNGTIALQIALRILGSGYEVITTPFSYVATASSIVWQNCKPIFVDIDPSCLTINEVLIEEAITTNTKAILATHVFGNPCAIEAIDKIAEKHGLVVIYDAAHAFGVAYKGQSIFNYGDISTCSFHATKLFHTAEGGAIFCSDKKLMHQIKYSTNFGHNGQYDYHGLGINAKMSELHAAMGLSVLPAMGNIIEAREEIVNIYRELLNWEALSTITIRDNTKWNCSYFPVIFESEEALLKCARILETQNIFSRRYFYPSLNTIDYLQGAHMPVAEDISKRILCLPLYYGLDLVDVVRICRLVNSLFINKVYSINYLTSDAV